MRWLLLLVLPVLLISWTKPARKSAHAATVASKPNDGDTLKLDDLLFADFFSPNGDGHNDTYIIVNVETYPSNNSLKVFNRWGEVVYLASPYQNDWDGTSNQGGSFLNKQLTDGVYYFEFYNGKGNKANGKITIKR
jgi:gliding motility-associated-like protein